MDSINEKLLEDRLGDVSLVTKELSVDSGQQIGTGHRLSVIHIPGGKHKVKDLSSIVNNTVEFKSIEPAAIILSLCC